MDAKSQSPTLGEALYLTHCTLYSPCVASGNRVVLAVFVGPRLPPPPPNRTELLPGLSGRGSSPVFPRPSPPPSPGTAILLSSTTTLGCRQHIALFTTPRRLRIETDTSEPDLYNRFFVRLAANTRQRDYPRFPTPRIQNAFFTGRPLTSPLPFERLCSQSFSTGTPFARSLEASLSRL